MLTSKGGHNRKQGCPIKIDDHSFDDRKEILAPGKGIIQMAIPLPIEAAINAIKGKTAIFIAGKVRYETANTPNSARQLEWCVNLGSGPINFIADLVRV